MIKLKPNCVVDKMWDGDVRMTLKEGLSDEILDYIRSNDVDYFVLKEGDWSNLDRLLEFKEKIVKLSIDIELPDWSVISNFTNLKKIMVDGRFKNCNIDFSKLKKLRSMKTYWNGGYEKYLKDVKSIKALSIISYQCEDLSCLGEMENLEFLQLIKSRKIESLSGIEKFKNLKFFEADGCSKLSDVSALTSLKKLKTLYLYKCTKDNDYEVLSKLGAINEMYLGGELNDIKWVSSLKTLTRLRFDCKLVDGELSFLYDMPALQQVLFNNKKNYTVKIKDIQGYLEDKGHNQLGLRETQATFADGY